MRRAMEYCRMFDKPVLSHAEDIDLTRGGVMNEGIREHARWVCAACRPPPRKSWSTAKSPSPL